jgi:RND family efflux transporter MFP subunit
MNSHVPSDHYPRAALLRLATLSASVLLILLAGCGRHSSELKEAASELPAAKVQVFDARSEVMTSLTEVVGTIRPAQRALIAAKLMGTIEDMPIVLGQRVRQGDLLLKISAGEMAARVLQAQSQLNQARRDLETSRALLVKGATTSDSVRSMEDRFAMTEAMVREAEIMLSYTSVRAPFDGVISRKIANAGDLASPGMLLLELEGSSEFQVEAGIPDSLASSLTVGFLLKVDIAAVGLTLQGKVVELSSAADPAARTVPAKIALPSHAAVRSGQFARVQVPGAPIHVMSVPESSLSRQGQIETIFVVGEQSRAVLRIVKTGSLREGRREILAGLSEGDRVVSVPPTGLREGQKLEVQP